MSRDLLLLRLREYGIDDRLWQHLRAINHTLKIRVLYGDTPDHVSSDVDFLKGLPKGGRLSPLLWALYAADLVRLLRKDFPHLTLPPPYMLFFIGILLFVDDFCLIASFYQELMALIQKTQDWCERNQCELSFGKSKIMVFFETLAQSRRHTDVWSVVLLLCAHPHTPSSSIYM